MTWIRKIALALLLTAAVAVLVVSITELWNYRQWDYLPLHAPHATDVDQRARALEDRVEILTRRVGDMELLAMVLLGTCGLYAIVFVATSYLSSMAFARQADRAIAHIKDEIGTALGDMRELKEETEREIEEAPVLRAAKFEDLRAEARVMIREELAMRPTRREPIFARAPADPEAQLASMLSRAYAWTPENMDDQAKLELLQYEDEAARLEVSVAPELLSALADLYRNFARLNISPDQIRARFHLTRALKLVPADSPLASELHYDLACCFAGNRDFGHAMGELILAFRHHSSALDHRLANDIDEGGRLGELASTPPFDKELNDMLLNVSVP